MPAILFVTYLVVRYARALPLPRLLAPALVAVLGHIALCAAFRQWHGGYSYGPRLLTPLVPWLVLLSAMGLRARLARRGRGARMRPRWGPSSWPAACSCTPAGRAHARHGPGTASRPTRHDPDKLWSWHDPQFLAGLARSPNRGRILPTASAPDSTPRRQKRSPTSDTGGARPNQPFAGRTATKRRLPSRSIRIEALDLGMNSKAFFRVGGRPCSG